MDYYLDPNYVNNVELSPLSTATSRKAAEPTVHVRHSLYGGDRGEASPLGQPSERRSRSMTTAGSSSSPPRARSEGAGTLPPSSPDFEEEKFKEVAATEAECLDTTQKPSSNSEVSVASKRRDGASLSSLRKSEVEVKSHRQRGESTDPLQKIPVRVRQTADIGHGTAPLTAGTNRSSSSHHRREERSKTESGGGNVGKHSSPQLEGVDVGEDHNVANDFVAGSEVSSLSSQESEEEELEEGAYAHTNMNHPRRRDYGLNDKNKRYSFPISEKGNELGGAKTASNANYRLGTSERLRLEALLKAKRHYERKRKDEERYRQECTFTPRVNTTTTTSSMGMGTSIGRGSSVRSPSVVTTEHEAIRSDRYSARGGGGGGGGGVDGDEAAGLSVEERLLLFEKQRRAKLQRELAAKIESDAAQFSFAPTLDRNSLNTARKLHPPHLPVEERLMHYKSSVEESRRILRERALLEEEAMRRLATPMTLLNKERRLRRSSSAPHPLSSNNTEEGGGAVGKAADARSNSATRRGTPEHLQCEHEKSFLTRMREAEMQKQASMAMLKDKELSAYTFKPTISKMSRLYVEEKDRQQQEARSYRRAHSGSGGERGKSEVNTKDDDHNDDTRGYLNYPRGDLNESQANKTQPPRLSNENLENRGFQEEAADSKNNRIEALYSDAMRRQYLLSKKRQAKEIQETATLGKPAISAGTEKIVKEGTMREVYNCDFVQRQEIFQQLAKDHAKVLKKVANSREKVLSQPQLSSITKSIYALHTSARSKQQRRKRHHQKNVRGECYSDNSDDNDDDRSSSVSASSSSSTSTFDPFAPPKQTLTATEVAEQVDRLYTQSTAVSRQLREILIAERQKDECSFKPVLSPATVLLLKTTVADGERPLTVVERLTRGGGETVGAKDKKAGQPTSSAETPRKRSSSGAADDKVNDEESSKLAKHVVTSRDANEFYRRQMAVIRLKELKIAEQRALKSVEEQKDCTFQPEIRSSTPTRGGGSSSRNGGNTPFRRAASAPQSTNTSAISSHHMNASAQYNPSHTPSIKAITGAQTFLRRQETARRQRQEKEEMLQNVGRGLKCNGPNFTVVRPFNLTSGRGQGRDMAKHFDPVAHAEQPLIIVANEEKNTDEDISSSIVVTRPENRGGSGSRVFGKSINPNISSVAYPFMVKGSLARDQFMSRIPSTSERSNVGLEVAKHVVKKLKIGNNQPASTKHIDDVEEIFDDTTAAVTALLRATAKYEDSPHAAGANEVEIGSGAASTYTINLGGSPPVPRAVPRFANDHDHAEEKLPIENAPVHAASSSGAIRKMQLLSALERYTRD